MSVDYSAMSLLEYWRGKMLSKNMDIGKPSIIRENVSILMDRNIKDNIISELCKTHVYYAISADYSIALSVVDSFWIELRQDANIWSIDIYGSPSYIDIIKSVIFETGAQLCGQFMEWIYNEHGHSRSIPILNTKFPMDEMYPFLNGESLTDYYDRYMKSDESIMILYGPPGTGKTSFIRGLMIHSDISAMVSYNWNILDNDSLFAEFMSGENSLLVLEDCDIFLNSRKEGNTMMHRFLNVSDGLVSVKGKKIIFTTNLPTIKDIDDALIRPGRCFDTVKFDTLTYEQAMILANKIGLELLERKDSYTVAEIFNKKKSKTIKQNVGFI